MRPLRLLSSGIVACSLFMGMVSTAQAAASATPSQFIISNADASSEDEIKKSKGGRRIGPGVFTATSDEASIGDLKRRHPRLIVERDLPVRATELPNDPCVTSCGGPHQWYLSSIRSSEAWGASKGTGVLVAILDTGVDVSHPDLASKVDASIDLSGSLDGPGAHGTAVAGIAAAATNNGLGVAGMAWNSRILSVKVLDSLGSGLTSAVVHGIYEATLRGAKVINLSLTGGASQALKDAVDYAISNGAIVVAAAGNEGGATPKYPAAYPNVLSVGAVGSDGRRASFSNYGSWVDLYAPGVGLYTTSMGNAPYGSFTGTSAATPVVSGVAALMIAQGTASSPAAIETKMIQMGASVTDAPGWRRLDAGAALGVLPPKPAIASQVDPFPGFIGGVKVAYGDLDGDGKDEVIVGAGPGGGPHVRTFKLDGTPISSFFAYTPYFTGGIDVAAGDIDGDGRDEIITGAGPGGGPHVSAFKSDGSQIVSFFAYTPYFRGGIDVTAGDVDGDGRDEIITGAGPGGGPHVSAFKPDASQVVSFFAYTPYFTGGIDVAAGDIDGDGKDEIITGAGPGGGPHVTAFRPSGAQVHSFFAYSQHFTGGVKVAVADTNRDGTQDIITGAGSGGGPHVRVFNGRSTSPLDGFFAFASSFSGGVDVAGAYGVVGAGMLGRGSLISQRG